MNLENSVILPREDFVELQEAAWAQTPATTGERVASTVQTTIICFAAAAAVTAGTWGWAKACDWKDERTLARAKEDPKYKVNPTQ